MGAGDFVPAFTHRGQRERESSFRAFEPIATAGAARPDEAALAVLERRYARDMALFGYPSRTPPR